jgi:hypothetical protein
VAALAQTMPFNLTRFFPITSPDTAFLHLTFIVARFDFDCQAHAPLGEPEYTFRVSRALRLSSLFGLRANVQRLFLNLSSLSALTHRHPAPLQPGWSSLCDRVPEVGQMKSLVLRDRYP